MKYVNIILLKDEEKKFEKMTEKEKKEIVDKINKQGMESMGYQKL